MKVLCDVCDNAPATVMCCSDEAALCSACDTSVHGANKLASKHQRIPLLARPPHSSPPCDVCQEKTPYFFCLEDRAFLCRDCDFSIHSCNSFTSNHQRFLVSGLRVGLHALPSQDVQPVVMSSPARCSSPRKSLLQTNGSSSTTEEGSIFQQGNGMVLVSSKTNSMSWLNPSTPSLEKGTESHSLNALAVGDGGTKNSASEQLMETIPGCETEDLVTFPDMALVYNFMDTGSSKVDTPNVWDLDWSVDFSVLEERAFRGSFAKVPQAPSPLTASGLWRPATKLKMKPEFAVFSECDDFSLVPDLTGQ